MISIINQSISKHRTGLLIIVECWGPADKCGGVHELEDYHFAIIIVKIKSGKNHQRTVNLGRNFDKGQDIFIILNDLPIDHLLVTTVKKIVILVSKLENILIGQSKLMSPLWDRWISHASKCAILRIQYLLCSILV